MANWYVSSNAYSNIKPWGGFTNLLQQSQTFQTTWAALNVSDATFATTTTAPDGTNTAQLLTENTTNGLHQVSQSVTGGTAQAYVLSVHAKSGVNRTRVALAIGDAASPTNGQSVTFDLATGYAVTNTTSGSGVTILNYGTAPAADGFTRCYVVVLCAASVASVYGIMRVDSGTGQAANSTSYAGTAGNGVYIWGAQLEKGTHIGPYTATTTAPVTTVGGFAANVGDLVRQSANIGANNVNSERVFRCTTAGTTGANEPSPTGGNPWALGKGQTTTDGTAVWTEVTGQEAYSTPGAWAAAARMALFNSGSQNYATAATVAAGGSGYAVGDVIRPTTGTAFGDYAYFKVSTISSGAVTGLTLLSGGSYSSSPTSSGATAAVTGTGTGLTITCTMTTGNWGQAAGDTLYLGSNHAESLNATYSIAPAGSATAPTSLVCVDETASGSVPPGTSNLKTGAVVATGAGNALNLYAVLAEVYGITFRAGSSSGANIAIGNFGHTARLNNCLLALPGTGANTIVFGSAGNGNLIILDNTPVSFGNTSQYFVGNGNLFWRNTLSAIQGVVPSSLINSNAYSGQFLFEGLDLSALGSGKTIVSSPSATFRTTLKNCLLGAGVTVATVPISPANTPTDLITCDSGTGYYRNERYRGQATMTTDPVVTRTGGASDGSTAISHKIVSTTQAVWSLPFESFPLAIYNSTVGSTVTATVCGIVNAAALPNNDEVWLQVSYLGSATSPLATVVNATKSNVLATGTALTADTSAWDANVTARANSTAYTVGQTIKTASNAGRVFFCITAGTSAASEPAGYASAVDGGSVTDGTAVFRAGVRFKQSVALSSPAPAAAGLLTVTPKVGKASTTYYLDPLVTLS